MFYTLREAQILIEQWRIHYNSPLRDIAAQYLARQWSGHIARWGIGHHRWKASSR